MPIKNILNLRLLTVVTLSFSSLVWSHIGWCQYNPVQENIDANPKFVELGRILFHDPSLSNPPGQSCASCHQQALAFTDGKTVSEGATKGVFGKRNTPTLSYAKYTLPFSKEKYNVIWSGGLFWDGRAASLEEQALGPFFNSLEMNTDKKTLAKQLRTPVYREKVATLFGKKTLKDDDALINAAATAIAHFQRTEVFSPFTSKYDYVLAGKAKFTALEERGEQVFSQDAACGECHLGMSKDERQLFTNYEYHNIGLPKNPDSEFLKQSKKHNPEGEKFTDQGLAFNATVEEKYRPESRGLFKTPTLRNVALTAPYMHNGVFKTLREVADFYNANGPERRTVEKAEMDVNRTTKMSANLGLSEKDLEALVAFMETLSDGYSITK